MKPESKKIMHRSYLVAFGFLIFASLIFFQLCKIQFVEGDKYKEIAQKRVFKDFVIQANRGNVYDANYNLLATSVPKFDVRFDAVTVAEKLFKDEVENLAKSLSNEFGKSTAYYSKLLRKARVNKNRYLLLCRNVGYAQYMRVKSFPILNKGGNRGGFISEQRTIREHPIGKIAERTVGYERIDENGYKTRVGLEGAYGNYLSGKEGRRLKQKISKGQWKPVFDNNQVEPVDGSDVVSTIDVNIQDIAHHALLEQLEKYKADHGSVVVMETHTGEVKAISNLARTSQGKYYEKLNYAVGESHEPGSTFKLMSMVALLEDTAIDSSSVVDTEKGRVKFYDRTVYDSHWGGYGKISLAEAFKVSSNTAFAKLIHQQYKKDPKKLLDRFYNMGLSKPLGLPIKGEGKPKLPYPGDANWYGTTLPWMAFGYGVSLTPLQTLAFYNAIANNGELVKPQFIKEVRSFDKVKQSFGKEVLNPSVCSQKTVNVMKDLMEQVVNNGTARNIKSSYIQMAGKTGTCQKNYNKGKDNLEYISSFVGYFPANDPKYSCIVVIHEPKKDIGFYGNIVAAPVFSKIAHKIHSGMPITDKVTLNDSIDIKSYKKYYMLSQKYKTIMPDVKGMSLMDALPLLENLGLEVKVLGDGKVVKQSIPRGEKIGKRTLISLQLS